jgi:DNA-binding protein YbaB
MGSDKEDLRRWADLVLDGKPINIDQTIRQQAARIAELEATERELRDAVKVLAKGGSDMAVMIDKYAAIDTDKQETVDAYIAAAAQCRQSADAVEGNQIAAAAVREAGR